MGVGPFELIRRIGSGGEGVVWSGRHRETGTPVAVKVLRRSQFADSAGARFRDEVRAVAALDHPHVVRVFDLGRVSASEAVPIRLPEGSPYLAMELIDRMPMPTSWGSLRSVLRQLLDALAHSHARGVIHRDVKPSNVLWRADRDAVLTDFGIAWLPRQGGVTAVGTPAFMAPEQASNDWRELGPWTDLYGLACTTWQLATGAPPFVGTMQEVLDAHRQRRAPPLAPRLDVPAELESWLHWLLEKRPQRRPLCAADAAVGLAAIGGPTLPGRRRPVTALAGLTLTALLASATPQTARVDDTLPLAAEAMVLPEVGNDRPASDAIRATALALPFPGTWRSALPAGMAQALAGVGLSTLR